ncbi:NUDIX domain-containing protein [Caulobacter vibrioides]|uniref:NUDIX hydrolase n=1 Tax=Caulobacter vibrioides TaxID=155892 RepID=UPI000BB4CA00|nr:NUDIX domain-containing protein [Caulobacter vibrioides]ATC24276.1 NUDIX domain-containing protein [Caulobacter vibrioides]AZH12523.1 NUDIX domain-containing protein [Caulobacter vibrioides]PLR14956.1 NUDIX domain-containing protein [Caulobacter vibrioides]
MNRVLDIVTAVIRDAEGRLLLVRKRGTAIFMKPGGKRDAGEDDLATLARELREELGCELVSAELLGHFSAPAANEAGFTVQSATYLAEVTGEISPRAEIEELAWVDPAAPGDRRLAPLLTDAVLPALRALA